MPTMMPAMHRLTLHEGDNVAAPPKRKSADGQQAAAPSTSNVVRHDSGQLPVRLILLSRLVGTREGNSFDVFVGFSPPTEAMPIVSHSF